MIRITRCTAATPGAVGILQLHGGAVREVLTPLTGREAWTDRRAYLCRFGEIDEGLAILLADNRAQLMPHGGPRVVQQLIDYLTGPLGCAYDAAPDAQALYPEAASPIEADMLDAIARAASPAAIDLLAAQPTLWATSIKRGGLSDEARAASIERSRILDRLVAPPTVVVVGPANAGKSTLTNALMGKAVSIVADLPGTTRDWVGGLVELSADGGVDRAVAVNWLDTPGLRDSSDSVEQRAIALARQQAASADVLIAMRGRDQAWPNAQTLPRTPDLWVVNKEDDASNEQGDPAGASSDQPVLISAKRHLGLERLQQSVLARLGLDRLDQTPLWAFTDTLCRYADGQDDAAAGYLGDA